MIEKTFIHLPGVGVGTEEKLWSLGLHTWKDLKENLHQVFKGAKARKIETALEASEEALASGELEYFNTLLAGADLWRLACTFWQQERGHEIAYLDIETTGLGFPPESRSTTIAVLFQGQLQVEYEPHKKFQLLQQIDEQAKMLVTFNGGPFDLPFLRREFALDFRQAHLDLRFWFARMDHRGGLKSIQRRFPEIPQREYMDIDGFDAVRLWRMHEMGIDRALETLQTYNAEDTVVLEQLVAIGIEMERERRPFLKIPNLPRPVTKQIPTRVCPEVYRILRAGSAMRVRS